MQMKRGINYELENARLAIEGALSNPDILKKLQELGYSRKEILVGKGLYEKTKLLKNLRNKEDSDKCNVTSGLHAAQREADLIYKKHVKMARLAIPKDRKHWLVLELSGLRKKDLTGWLDQTQSFYAHLEPVAALLAQHGVAPEELAQAKAMIEAVAAARVEQNKGVSDVQHTKEQRDIALKELRQWMKKFIKAARYAFDDNKQKLEALGVVVPSK